MMKKDEENNEKVEIHMVKVTDNHSTSGRTETIQNRIHGDIKMILIMKRRRNIKRWKVEQSSSTAYLV
jgi:hypothetical protein